MTIEQKDLDSAFVALETKLKEAVGKYEGQVAETGKAASAVRADVKALAEEFKQALESSVEMQDRLKELEQKTADGFRGTDATQNKSWGQSFVESDALNSFRSGEGMKARIEVKNTIIGEGGSPANPIDTLVQADRLPGIVPGAFRSLNVLDFVPMGVTGSNQIEYTRELSFTNDAAETREGVAKPESDLTFELVNDPVRTIAHFIRASKQVLDDAPMLQSYIDRRMRHGLQARLQSQILKGNGTSPNIAGLSASGRHTAFVPETGEIALDSLNRAKYAIIGADYEPNVIIMNPADFGAIERVKSTSSSNDYAAGSGAALAYINGGMTPLLWGLPVVTSNDVASGKFYMMDSNAIQLFMRQGIVVEMFEQDSDNVTKNLLTIRAEMRGALAVYTPLAVRYGDLLI
jgi:HK97 family phage major capsid protein